MELEMDVEDEKCRLIKRKVENYEEKADDSDEFYITFFEHFTVPAQLWGCIDKIVTQEPGVDGTLYPRGLAYLHKETNRPLLVLKLRDLTTGRVIGYKSVFRLIDSVKEMPCCNDYVDDESETLEQKGGRVILSLAQIDEQYTLEGVLATPEQYIPYYKEFLNLTFMYNCKEVEPLSLKKRRLAA
jgi:hypothetical protein